MNDARNIRQCWILCNEEGCGSSPFPRIVFGCVSTRNVRSPLYCFKKGFVVTVISQAVCKFTSVSYVTVLVKANAAKAKCKGV